MFFLLSLFLVYLAKPVIKRVPREEQGKKARPQPTAEDRRAAVSSSTGRIYADQGDYLPPVDYRTGPVPQQPQPAAQRPAPPRQAPGSPAWGEPSRARGTGTAAGFPPPPSGGRLPSRWPLKGRPGVPACPTQPGDPGPGFLRAPGPARRPLPSVPPRKGRRLLPGPRQLPSGRLPGLPRARRKAPPLPKPARQQPPRPAANTQPPRRASHVVRSVEIPDFSEDFFKKYDDPAYVERRLKELEEKQNKG